MKRIKEVNIRKKRQREGGQNVCYIDIDITIEVHMPALWKIKTSHDMQKTLAQRGFPRAVLNKSV
jgi:hypothetical protein